MYIDTHCHLLSLHSLQPLTPSLVSFAVLSMSVDLEDTRLQIKHLNSFNNVFIGAGVHPWYVTSATLDGLLNFPEFFMQSGLMFLGEIGLDFSKPYCYSADIQRDVLNFFLGFANDHGIPASFHVYKAYQPFYDLYRNCPVRGVLHGFAGGLTEARRFYDIGLKIGVNGLILRDSVPRYIEMVKALPLESIVAESDAPFVRYPDGRPADLAMVPKVIERIAQIKNLPLELVASKIYQNSLEVFSFVKS